MRRSRIALIGLSLSQQERLARAGLDRVDGELEAQILPDGGHVSRNPAALVDILVDLLPLRQALIARGLVPSETLLHSIDRMMPMLRFFRHGDGAFAHFNGVAASAGGLVATVISYDETLGAPAASATYSGYERVEGARFAASRRCRRPAADRLFERGACRRALLRVLARHPSHRHQLRRAGRAPSDAAPRRAAAPPRIRPPR